jgi:hypothetical protein
MAPSLRTRNPDRSYTTGEKRVSEVEEALVAHQRILTCFPPAERAKTDRARVKQGSPNLILRVNDFVRYHILFYTTVIQYLSLLVSKKGGKKAQDITHQKGAKQPILTQEQTTKKIETQ